MQLKTLAIQTVSNNMCYSAIQTVITTPNSSITVLLHNNTSAHTTTTAITPAQQQITSAHTANTTITPAQQQITLAHTAITTSQPYSCTIGKILLFIVKSATHASNTSAHTITVAYATQQNIPKHFFNRVTKLFFSHSNITFALQHQKSEILFRH